MSSIGAKTELFAQWLSGRLVIADQANGFGKRWFVDAANANGGVGGGFGVSPEAPFTTMAAALAACVAGDVIYFQGTIAEGALTLAANNVSIVGIGPDPTANVWQQSAADQTLLTITGTHCKLKNMRIRVPTLSAGTPIGVALSGASGLQIEDCYFSGRTGSAYALSSDGSSDNVAIRRTKFMYMNTAVVGTAIFGHTYGGADIIHSGWLIEDCVFHSNLRHIVARMRQSVIRRNQFAEIGLAPAGGALTATVKIDLSGGANALWNLVTGNQMPGDYSNTGGYTAGTNDNWVGNFADDVEEAEVGDNGITLAIPAA